MVDYNRQLRINLVYMLCSAYWRYWRLSPGTAAGHFNAPLVQKIKDDQSCSIPATVKGKPP
jgi:hypothetical protein